MTRIKLVSRPADFPGTPDEETGKNIQELFQRIARMYGREELEIPGSGAAFAAVAQNPKLALKLLDLSDYILFEMPWTSQRKYLKQLAIQALNLHFGCDNSFQSHIGSAQRDGVSLEKMTLIPFWKTANVFDDEERLVIEFTMAVVTGTVPEELFSRVVEQYGETEAIELSIAIGWWSLWAMMINATGIEFDYGYGKK